MSLVIKAAAQAKVVNYVNLCSTSLLVYDTFLNIDVEVVFRYLSSRKWTFVECVYVASKYLAFVDGALTVRLLLQPGIPPQECMRLYKTDVYFILVGGMLAEVILQCQAWAIWGLSSYVLAYLVVTDMVIVALAFYGVVGSFKGLQFVTSLLPTIRPCFPEDLLSGHSVFIAYMSLIVAEVNVLALMLWKRYVEWRGNGVPLFQVLYRDGMVYLFCLFALSIGNVLFYTTQDKSLYWMLLPEMQRIGHAILAARLLLDVRACADRGYKSGLDLQSEDEISAESESQELERIGGSTIYFAAQDAIDPRAAIGVNSFG
ncbi:hypothetical protein SCHPADRAFT_635555 [Schizopora paradoxa]|uniref:DUF6533 domain-containing protein n=1 Tax=Schizopora paradoxa TaxID=27342 RepID=A0A0H2R7G4_9AGAM|nr:hypothetical protein SCHPADRAFT_635555 [Schizopora paradoxa]